MPTVRRRFLQRALVVLPVISLAGAVLAQPSHAPPAGTLSMEELH